MIDQKNYIDNTKDFLKSSQMSNKEPSDDDLSNSLVPESE